MIIKLAGLRSKLGFLWPLIAILAHCASPVAASSIDRAAAFKQVITTYRYDHSQPLHVVVKKIKKYPECVMLTIVYSGAGGERVPAIVFEPFHASRWHPVPAIILLHRLSGSKEEMVPLGHFLAATGYASLIIDEWGHGERARPAASQNTAIAEETALVGFEDTVIDVRRGVDYLQTRPHINPHRIGLLGFSLGAIIGADVMGIEGRIRAAVLVSGGGNIGEILKNLADHDPLAGKQLSNMNWNAANILLTAIDPLTFASHMAPRFVLMQNGTADTIVTPDCANALYQTALRAKRSHVEIDWCQGCGHVLPLGQIYPHMRVWLDKNLKGESYDPDITSTSQ